MRHSYVVAVIVALSALAVGADTALAATYSMGEPDPAADGFTSGGAANCQRGWIFTCNSAGIVITEMGCRYPDSTSQAKIITLWEVSSVTQLAQVTTTPGAAWCWAPLATPVPLTQGQQYLVTGFTTTASYYYHYTPLPGAYYHGDANIEYVDMRYANSCNKDTYPQSSVAGSQYGIVDVGYTTGLSIVDPAPGSNLAEATTGQLTYSDTFEADYGTTPYTWSLSGAPAWLDFNTNVGTQVQLVNTAPVGAAGTYTMQVTVTDALAATANGTYTLTVNAQPVVTGPGTLNSLTETGDWATAPNFTVTGGTSPFTWSVTGAPPGVTIDTNGTLGGPVDAGTAGGSPYGLTVTVQDASGFSDSIGPLALTVNSPPVIAVPTMPDADVGVAYSHTLTASLGTTPYDWSATGTLGPFSINAASGAITGTPAALGTYSFDVTVEDDCGVTDTITISILVAGVEIIDPPPGALTDATETQTGYSVSFECDGSYGPFTWALTGAPGWLAFNPATGTQVALEAATVGAAGSYTFDVTVTASDGRDSTESYTILVNAPPTISGPATLDPMTETRPLPSPVNFTVSDGTGPYTWSIDGKPDGMIFSASGSLYGAPDAGTSAGSPYDVLVTVEDSRGVQATFGPLALVVNPLPTIDALVPPGAPLGIPYSLFMTVSDGTPPYAWSLSGVTGPFNIDSASGEITGTPGVLGAFSFDVHVEDACGATDSATIFINVLEGPQASAPTIPTLTETGTVPAGLHFTGIGGDPGQYDWTYTGSLPPGLTLTPVQQGNEWEYEFGGAPGVGTAGQYSIDVTVTDLFTTLSDSISASFSISPLPVIDLSGGTELATATMTGAWTHTFALEAGTATPPVTWAIGTVTGPNATLPGLTLTDSTLSATSVGSPTGSYAFELVVTDTNGVTDTQTFTLEIRPTASLPSGFPYAEEGTPYDETISVAPGTGVAPYTLSVVQGFPPLVGLTITTVGGDLTIAGTPSSTSTGQYQLQIAVEDANNVSVTLTVEFVVTVGPTESGCCGMAPTRSNAGTLLLLALLVPFAVGLLRRRF